MKYRRKTVQQWKYDAYRVWSVALLIVIGVMGFNNVIQAQIDKWDEEYSKSILRPLVSIETLVPVEKVIEVPQENIDTWVDKYVRQYFTGYQISEMKMIMHCLLHRESEHQPHDVNGPHGDSGKAGGLLQFHQPTWDRMRGQMLKAELINEIGSRYDAEQAIHTTVWAIKNGRALEWGPVLRWSKGKHNQAACQTPSWYNK